MLKLCAYNEKTLKWGWHWKSRFSSVSEHATWQFPGNPQLSSRACTKSPSWGIWGSLRLFSWSYWRPSPTSRYIGYRGSLLSETNPSQLYSECRYCQTKRIASKTGFGWFFAAVLSFWQSGLWWFLSLKLFRNLLT